MNRKISLLAFWIGLIAILWVTYGYIGGSGIALGVSLLIAAVYLAGAQEMRRYQANTQTLADALVRIPEDLGHLGEWLQQVPPALQNSVRLRIEGERVALPGPSLTPYLVGLLVLLGMLGTFLGMVVTLNGAVLALESTTDLHTIRAALAAPVKGLGVAFGTSVAGVAASAMLGLISALCRRERQQVGQLLDAKIASVLRDFSLAHQRQETFKALQNQAQSLPELVSRIDSVIGQMAEQNRLLGERLLSSQENFHRDAKALYSELALSVDQSLKTSLRESAALAAETIQPVVTATMQGIAGETRKLHDGVFSSINSQVETLSQGLGAEMQAIGLRWESALERQEASHARQETAWQQGAAAYGQQFAETAERLLSQLQTRQQEQLAAAEKQATALRAQSQSERQALLGEVGKQLEQIGERLDDSIASLDQQWQKTQAQQAERDTRLDAQLSRSLQDFATQFSLRAQDLLAAVTAQNTRLHAALSEEQQAFANAARTGQLALGQQLAEQLGQISQRLDQAVQQVGDTWQNALAEQAVSADRLTSALEQTQSSLANRFAEQSSSLLATQQRQQSAWQAEWAAGENARQAAQSAALGEMAQRLEQAWQATTAQQQAQQQGIVDHLGETARELVAATRAQAETTIAEVTRLMHTAAEAPKAAAEVIGQLRQELSASMARDNSLLEERSRIMETLGTLLDAINHASREQKQAIDALVSTAYNVLERSGQQFSQRVEKESEKLAEIGTGIAGGALEVASLGEAFGQAVRLFGESNDKMMGTLQRIEAALAKSLTRSDEQLAYYVAQAREIIDLSIMSQKQIVDELHRAAKDGQSA